jgi:hypothetical protein
MRGTRLLHLSSPMGKGWWVEWLPIQVSLNSSTFSTRRGFNILSVTCEKFQILSFSYHHLVEVVSGSNYVCCVLRLDVNVFEHVRYLALGKFLKISLRIEIETNHIIMTMGMYQIESPWVSICF